MFKIIAAAVILAATLATPAAAQNIAGTGCKAVQSGAFPQKAKDLRLLVHGVGHPEDGSVRVRVSDQWSGILCFPTDHPLRATAEDLASKAFEARKALVVGVADGQIVSLDLRPHPAFEAKPAGKPQPTPAGADGKPARPAKPKPAAAPAS